MPEPSPLEATFVRTLGRVKERRCFESEHGASCDVCLGEAKLAAEMPANGASLDAIRAAIDARFRS